MSDGPDTIAGMDLRLVRFVTAAGPEDIVVHRFVEPEAALAVLSTSARQQDDASLLVRIASLSEDKQALSAWMEAPGGAAVRVIVVKFRNGEVRWTRGRVLLLCSAAQAETLLAAIAEFAWYERALRLLEAEVATAWPQLEEDNRLAFDVTAKDLGRSETVGNRMSSALMRRVRFARLEPHLCTADPGQPETSAELGENLRDAADLESRAETLDSQLGVFEHIYEMGSQRMGEYRAAREAHILEWIIVLLLAAEALAMIWQLVARGHL